MKKVSWAAGIGLLLIILLIVGIVQYVKSANSPMGKSYFLEDDSGSTFYTFGDSNGEGYSLYYFKLVKDSYGKIVGNIKRAGTFSVDGKTINCSFDDGQLPYKLDYKKVDGKRCVVDETGNVFNFDDPDDPKFDFLKQK